MHVCQVCAWYLQEPEEGGRFLELELRMVMSHHVGARNRNWILCKSSKCSKNHWTISPAPFWLFFFFFWVRISLGSSGWLAWNLFLTRLALISSAYWVCHLTQLLLFKISYWLQLQLPRCAWVQGHLLAHGQPTVGHTDEENWFSTQQLPPAKTSSSVHFRVLTVLALCRQPQLPW